MSDKIKNDDDYILPNLSTQTTTTTMISSINNDDDDDHNDNSLHVNMDGDDHRDHDHDRKNNNNLKLSIESISSNSKSRKQFLKYISLITLTIQNASLTLFMRAAKTQKEAFISSTAVIMAELLKLITCIFMIYRDEGKCLRKTYMVIKKIVINQPMETLKVAVPAIVYYIQNNLIYVAATHLDPATSQVTYQLKILTTALFSVFLLNKKLVLFQWFSLIILFIGVACVQLTQRSNNNSNKLTSNTNHHEQNILIGFMAILTACILSGFAGVYFEKILKNCSNISLWIRNLQLAAIAIPFGLIQVFITDREAINDKGFFHGYTLLTWTVILLNAQGGLLVAVVVKYADNILKGFATSISIIISCIVSIYVFDFIITSQFIIGASLVISSVFLYNKPDLFTSNDSMNKLKKLFSSTRR